MSRRPSSTVTRRKCLAYWSLTNGKMLCYLCGTLIDPVQDAWEAEHEIPRELGGSDIPPNVKPAHQRCHRSKTQEDRPKIDKSRRQREKHSGVQKRGGKFKGWRRMDGTVVWAKRRHKHD